MPLGYSFQFSEKLFNLYYKYDIIGNDTLSDGLFSLDLRNATTHNVMHIQIGIK